jgi:hypothetical protein
MFFMVPSRKCTYSTIHCLFYLEKYYCLLLWCRYKNILTSSSTACSTRENTKIFYSDSRNKNTLLSTSSFSHKKYLPYLNSVSISSLMHYLSNLNIIFFTQVLYHFYSSRTSDVATKDVACRRANLLS